VNPAKLATLLNEAAGFHRQGVLDRAESLYRDVLKKVPRQPDALHLLGVLLDQRGDRTKGIGFVRKAIAAKPNFPDAHANLAAMLSAGGDFAAAKNHYEKALALKPGHARAYNGLGVVYRAQRQYPEAAGYFERAIRQEPRLIDAYINLCNTYRDARLEVGIPSVAGVALTLDPNNAQLHLLLSEAHFTAGNLGAGWLAYEWRFKSRQNPVVAQDYPLPAWSGEDLREKGLLIWYEQGVGDEIIFASMVPGVAAQAKRCVLQTTPRLVPLFQRSFPGIEVYGGLVPPDVVAALDVQSAIGSLGQWARPSFRDFPVRGTYLCADPARSAAFRAKYRDRRQGNLVVGIAWYSAKVTDAAEKSVDLSQWGAILSVPGVTFVNLQYGDNRAALNGAKENFGADIIDDPEVDAVLDLDGFAAQVAAVDLVISTSNTAAHMAGALGVPIYCIIPRALGCGRRWYWFGEGIYVPWYRSMMLFRQNNPQTWSDVLLQVGLALVAATAQHGALSDPVRFIARLARRCLSAGMKREAEMAYDSALSYDQNAVEPLRESAKLKFQRGAAAEALPLIARAALAAPESAQLHDIHGIILAHLGRHAEAVAAYRRAIERAPDQAGLYNNMGTSLKLMGDSIGADECYAKALQLKPADHAIALNAAMTLSEIGKPAEALMALDRLIAEKPDFVDAHYNRAMVLLGQGRLGEGWSELAWRMKRPQVPIRHSDFETPVWNGENLSGRHVLTWTELGLGDEILGASMIPDLTAAAKAVTFLCSPRLVALFRRSFPGIRVDARQLPPPPSALQKGIDYQMSVAELGAAFRPTFESFPGTSHYLRADETLRHELRTKYLAKRKGNLLVGVSWRSINPEIGRVKSIPLAAWLPILQVPGITFINLQYGDCVAEIDDIRRAYNVDIIDDKDINPSGDMDPLAAQVAAMDLVISISNTTVHLAGGLGIPTWMLLPRGHARLWYWFRGSERCVWYPNTGFLEMGEGPEAWHEMLAAVSSNLARFAHKSS